MLKILSSLNPFYTDEGGENPDQKLPAKAAVTPTTGDQSIPVVNSAPTMSFSAKASQS